VAYQKLAILEAPKRSRVRIPLFEHTREWQAMKTDLDKGIEPGGALMVTLEPQDQLEHRITNRRTVARYVKKYVATRNLPYKVKSFERAGVFHVLVAHW
jgi:hypothetical protein